MTSKMVVSKFGGSSVRDSIAFKRSSNIIVETANLKLVVVSATYDTTNQLEKLASLFLSNYEEAFVHLDKVIERHLTIASELEIKTMVEASLQEMANEIRNLGPQIAQQEFVLDHHMDEVYALGERMSSTILWAYLQKILPHKKVILVDARDVIVTNTHFRKASPLCDEIKQKAETIFTQLAEDNVLYISQGFIGRSVCGQTTTLGREGSDFSAALFAEAIGASDVYIWTDVEGVATCDPRVVNNVQFIPHMSYEDAELMATYGAKVLFPRTLEPAKRGHINVYVKNSYDAAKTGTVINNEKGKYSLVVGMAFCDLHIENKDYLKITFVGENLLKSDFAPHTHLSDRGLFTQKYEVTEKIFSFLVDKKDEKLALELSHNLLLDLLVK